MTRAKLSPRAQQDLQGICDYIAAERPNAAERVRATILETADLLAQNPSIGRPIRNTGARHADVRWLVVPRFRNYLMGSEAITWPDGLERVWESGRRVGCQFCSWPEWSSRA
jgi:plasmid stabilization system protein ParE